MKTVLRQELRLGAAACAIWSGSIAVLLAVCIFLFPEMKSGMDGVSELFASMGSFTAAFGMDRLNFGTLTGFYAIECGNILGLGGAFFAALTAVGILSKEERGHTADFLLTHPLTRLQAAAGKLCAVLVQILLLNAVALAVSLGSIVAVGETIPWRELLLLHLAHLLLQIEVAAICFCISAFLRRGGAGAGLGLAILFYMLNLLANISDQAAFLRHLTPFAYVEGAAIVADGRLDLSLVLPGMAAAVLAAAVAFVQYRRQDIL